MPSRPLAGLGRRRSVVLGVLLAGIVLAALAGLALVVTHGPAGDTVTAGAAGSPVDGRPLYNGSSFSTVPQAGGAYAIEFEERHQTDGGVEGFTYRFARFANGSAVERVRYLGGGIGGRRPNVSSVVTVRRADVEYERTVHRSDVAPATLVPDVYLAEPGTLVERSNVGNRASRPAVRSLDVVLDERVLVRNGTATRNGRTFHRFDLAGPKDVLERLAGEDDLTGYVLVTEDRLIRYAAVRTADGSARVTYRASPGRTPAFPSWLPDAKRAFDRDPPALDVRAYRRAGVVSLIAESAWTPARNVSLVVVSEDGAPMGRVRLPANESAFDPRSAGTDVSHLGRRGGGPVLAADATDLEPIGGGTARELIVDWRGRNLRVVPVGAASELASVYSVTAAHLRPRNGGGRVLRVDDLSFGDAVGPDRPVTIRVGNGTSSRSLTVPAGDLSSDRFYLSRTPDGLAVENSGGIATHVSPAGGFADRRFVANATLTVEVWGMAVVERAVPRRATQAGSRPLDELLTGVAIETYDEPPDRSLLGYGDELRSMNWTGYTMLAVHSWDYDALHVTGGVDLFHPDVVREDHTSYYRASDGARFWIETANGTRLYAGTANGTEVVSP